MISQEDLGTKWICFYCGVVTHHVGNKDNYLYAFDVCVKCLDKDMEGR
jgi:hypothetical protein